MQEPAVVFGVSVNPVKRGGEDFLARFHAAFAYIICFVEARVIPPRRMTLGKSAYRGGFHVCFSENIHEIISVGNVGKSSVSAGRTPVGGGASVTDRAVAYAEHAGDKTCPRRQARRVGAVILVKANPIPAYFVHIGRGTAGISVTAHVIGSQCVNINK